MKISVIGGGSWGTALANHLANKGYQPITVLVKEEKYLKEINQDHTNNDYLPDLKLNENLIATMDYEDISDSDIILLSIPSHAMRSVVKTLKEYLGDNKPTLVSTTKGIEEGTHLRMSEVIISELGEEYWNHLTVLSGPTHAEEVSRGLPSSCVIAAKHKKLAESVQDVFMSPELRVYINPDIVGVEMGGSLKNIIAVAAGIADGLGYGDNTKAALITRGLTEIGRLGVAMGAQLMTFAGLSGMGDLVVTCASMHSRNRRFGIEIGKGKSLDEAAEIVQQVAEGVRTCRAVYNMIQDMDIEMPITTQCYKLLYEGKDPEEGVSQLMTRGAKHEIEEVAREDFEW